MKHFVLSADQQTWLRCELKQPTNAQAYRRSAALLAVHEGRSITDVAGLLGVTRQTIHNWLSSYAGAESVLGLADAHRSGRPSVWSEESGLALERTLKTPPQEVGLPAPNWTTPLLAKHLSNTLGREISAETIRRRLLRLGYDWHRGAYVRREAANPGKEVLTPPVETKFPFSSQSAIAA